MGYRRKRGDRKRLLKTYHQTKNHWCRGVYFDEGKNRFIRYSPSDSNFSPKFYKRMSNRKIRHSKHVANNNAYRKEFDYSWKVY